MDDAADSLYQPSQVGAPPRIPAGVFRTQRSQKLYFSSLDGVMLFLIVSGVWSSHSPPAQWRPASVVIIALIILLFGTVTWQVFVHELRVEDDAISDYGLLGLRSLAFAEVKGYRMLIHTIVLEPTLDSGKRRMTFDDKMEGFPEFVSWAKSRFKDLDDVDRAAQEDEILSTSEAGMTRGEFERAVAASSDSLTYWLAAGFCVLLGWSLLSGVLPYWSRAVTAMLFPWVFLAFASTRRFFFLADRKTEGQVIGVLFAVTAALVIRAVGDFKVFSSWNTVLFTLGIGAALSCAAFTAIPGVLWQKRRHWLNNVPVFLIFAGYGFGTTVMMNCLWGYSEPNVVETSVVTKWVHYGRYGTSYTVETQWHYPGSSGKFTVRRGLYDASEVGRPIEVVWAFGSLGIPYGNLDLPGRR